MKKKPAHGAKTALVRSLPRQLSASAVQEKAAAKGLSMSIAYIHNIRSALNKQGRLLKKSTLRGKKGPKEKVFVDLVVFLGPARAQHLLNKTEAALRSR